jgi:hypothetical protein
VDMEKVVVTLLYWRGRVSCEQNNDDGVNDSRSLPSEAYGIHTLGSDKFLEFRNLRSLSLCVS